MKITQHCVSHKCVIFDIMPNVRRIQDEDAIQIRMRC
jgi:hypothetical protein